MNLCQYLIVWGYRRVFHYFRDKVYVVNKGGIIFVEFMMI